MPGTQKKLDELKKSLAGAGKAVVAFSGGADSSLLLKAAMDALGRGNVLAATAESPIRPREETLAAEKLAGVLGVECEAVRTGECSNPGFLSNPPGRCYICKKELFSRLEGIRRARGFECVMEGSNADDTGDYRPGAAAGEELGVRSPLKEAGLTKAEIRSISKAMGLPTWDKPALACLASRIPYGEEITPDKLERIEKAEAFLKKKGLRHVRVRHHGGTARIEAEAKNIPLLAEEKLRGETAAYFKKIGFRYAAIDIEGYRTGSLNEPLKQEKAKP